MLPRMAPGTAVVAGLTSGQPWMEDGSNRAMSTALRKKQRRALVRSVTMAHAGQHRAEARLPALLGCAGLAWLAVGGAEARITLGMAVEVGLV